MSLCERLLWVCVRGCCVEVAVSLCLWECCERLLCVRGCCESVWGLLWVCAERLLCCCWVRRLLLWVLMCWLWCRVAWWSFMLQEMRVINLMWHWSQHTSTFKWDNCSSAFFCCASRLACLFSNSSSWIHNHSYNVSFNETITCACCSSNFVSRACCSLNACISFNSASLSLFLCSSCHAYSTGYITITQTHTHGQVTISTLTQTHSNLSQERLYGKLLSRWYFYFFVTCINRGGLDYLITPPVQYLCSLAPFFSILFSPPAWLWDTATAKQAVCTDRAATPTGG